jgi:hypothetical protein
MVSTKQITTTTEADAAAKEACVSAFFKKNFPNKADKLGGILAQYEGKEDALMKQLVFDHTRLQVHAHYTKYKPQSLDNVAKIVEAHQGEENKLLNSLKKKEKDIANWHVKIAVAYRSQVV